MSGSTSAPIFQIEDLLHSYGEVLAAKRAQETPPRKPAFDTRSLMAGFLAVFVFAPGCAAATAFLMKAEDRVPVIDPPSANKSNRMPLAQWKAQPLVNADRVAATPIAVDVSFLGPVEIRGRLDAEMVATAVEHVAPTPAPVLPRPRRKTDIRRAAPVSVVAEAVASTPDPEPPSLVEKLFALRNL